MGLYCSHFSLLGCPRKAGNQGTQKHVYDAFYKCVCLLVLCLFACVVCAVIAAAHVHCCSFLFRSAIVVSNQLVIGAMGLVGLVVAVAPLYIAVRMWNSTIATAREHRKKEKSRRGAETGINVHEKRSAGSATSELEEPLLSKISGTILEEEAV
mmetsp:Transcript_7790/g.13442  ORF Transcript_7790/g.13442 Transcript_7790/m.13442 type:complete len:154 (-) Transcript_7790:215-676(-)